MTVSELVRALLKCDQNVPIMAKRITEEGFDSRAIELVEQLSSERGTIVNIRLWSGK